MSKLNFQTISRFDLETEQTRFSLACPNPRPLLFSGKYDMEDEVISDEKTDDVGSIDGSVTFDDDAGDRAHAICFKLKTALENLELSQHGCFQHCSKPKHKTNSQRS